YEYPAPTITSPVSGDTLNTNTPTITGTALPGSEVEVTIGAQTLNATTNEDGEWSVVAAPLPDGVYVISAQEGESATAWASNVRIAYPVPTITSPVPGTTLSTQTPTF